MNLCRRRVSITGVVLAVLLLSALPWDGWGVVQARSQQKVAPGEKMAEAGASQKNTVLEAGMSRCEFLAERAEAGKVKDMDQTIQALEGDRARILGVLSPEAGKQFDAELAAIREKRAANDYPGVALEAVEIYRVLAVALDRGKLKVPVEVDLLDYAGFKTRLLTKKEPPDWETMKTVAAETAKKWQAIKGKVVDKNLQNLVNTVVAGLDQAAAKQDAAMAGFAGQVVLDLVDLLEQQFERQGGKH